jgi:hypothetical protein
LVRFSIFNMANFTLPDPNNRKEKPGRFLDPARLTNSVI